jgi:hypothetical protein
MNEQVRPNNAFSDGVKRLLQKVEYRLATTDAELDAHQRLRYDANLREGVILPNDSKRLTDQFENVVNGFNIGIYIDGELASALRLHVLSQRHPRSVLRQNYPDVVDGLVESGLQIIDITRLAANYDIARRYPQLLYVTVRLSMLACEHFDADVILAGVRREHLAFYKREFMATPLTEPRPYPTVIKPQSLFQIDYRNNRDRIVGRHSFYASTPPERWAIFGDPAPLLPSA